MAEIARKSKYNVRLIAIVWPLTNLPQNVIHRICSDRIVERGENHQTLRPLETGEHEIILMRFFGQTEPYDPAFNASSDALFDDVIEMNISWDFEKTLEVAIEKLLEIEIVPGNRRPSKQELTEAILAARGYKPSIYKEMRLEGLRSSGRDGGRSKGVRYYGILVEVDLSKLLESICGSIPKERSFFDKLQQANRIERKPHVTLVHECELQASENGANAEVELRKELWEKCVAIASKWGAETVTVSITLGPLLVWDTRAMSIQVSKVSYEGANVRAEDMPEDESKESYHITVGTISQEVKPIEGKYLLQKVLKGERKSSTGERIKVANIALVEAQGRVRGLM